jgi:hypothetical protein
MDTVIRVSSGALFGLRQLLDRGARKPAPAMTQPLFSAGTLFLGGLWLLIGLVGALDTYLTVRFRDVMFAVEENPLGRLLIRLGGGDVSLFVGLKVAGTILALGVLGWIGAHTRKSFAFAVITPVALAQITLVWYLFA